MRWEFGGNEAGKIYKWPRTSISRPLFRRCRVVPAGPAGEIANRILTIACQNPNRAQIPLPGDRTEGAMSAMKYLLVSCAVLAIALFVRVAPADAFSIESTPNGNGDDSGQSTKMDDRAPASHFIEGGAATPTPVLKLPSLDGTADKSQSGNAVHGSTFDPDETRFVFGPFNHFGYGGANQ
jgi:hypothetical protein